jgi:(2Fe-2S) ferredoxin
MMMGNGMPQPAFYLFKCEQSAPPGFPKPSCVRQDNANLFNYLTQKLMEKGIIGTVQPIRTSCLNRCQMGPIMLVEPGHHMYVALDEVKINRIIEEHIIGGNVIKEYLIPDTMWADAISPEDMIKMSGVN